MGMFDSVWVECPGCGKRMEFQSKAWGCEMDSWTLESAPGAVLYDIMNDPRYHETCGTWVALIDPEHPPGEPPRPSLSAAKVKPPENPHTHFQGFKWWPDEVEFTYEHLEDPPAHLGP